MDVQFVVIKKYRNEASIMTSLLSFPDQLLVLFQVSSTLSQLRKKIQVHAGAMSQMEAKWKQRFE